MILYHIHKVLRLCRRSDFRKRFNHVTAANRTESKRNSENVSAKKDFQYLLQKYKDKIKFSSYLEHEKLELGSFKYYLKATKSVKKIQQTEHRNKSLPPLPIALQYFVDRDRLLNEEKELKDIQPDKTFQLPFATTTRVQIEENNAQPNETVEHNTNDQEILQYDRSNMDKWMLNYEHFDDSQLDDIDSVEDDWGRKYGTPDPKVAVSRVPCGGCGALLHCSDPSIPGYLPSEIFKHRQVAELKTIECQRCHFLKEYNIALDVSVEPEEYEKLLQSIRHVKSLVILMVDLLDFPCSIWPGIVDIIGTDRPIIIVGNKVDLLPGDSIGYLKRIKQSLITEIGKTKLDEANIKHISLISAKTGYGVEDLISVLFKNWLYKGHVFLVGCTNVGKSSLFNALLQSDYCKVHAVDIVKRATVSRWPGTTLHLLKFPINRPSGWKIYQRTRRLNAEAKLMKIEKEIRQNQLQDKYVDVAPTLIGHIGRTFTENVDQDDDYEGAMSKKKLMVLDEKHKLFANSKWFYDTPGVVHPDQVLNLLSTEELLLTIPKKVIRPQTYYLKQGTSIFIGGLARIDHIQCPEAVRYTIFCSQNLPITVTNTEDADDVYETFVGTELFAAPIGGEERLRKWPGLETDENILEFEGEGPKTCCGDIVLSSVAWVAVTAKKGSVCKVAAWTPEGRGIYKRYPSVLPYSNNLKGKRVQKTPAYMVGKVFADD